MNPAANPSLLRPLLDPARRAALLRIATPLSIAAVCAVGATLLARTGESAPRPVPLVESPLVSLPEPTLPPAVASIATPSPQGTAPAAPEPAPPPPPSNRSAIPIVEEAPAPADDEADDGDSDGEVDVIVGEAPPIEVDVETPTVRPDAVRMTNAGEEPPSSVRSRILASRRPTSEDKVILGFKDVPVADTIRFIVESTGKVVMTRLIQIQTQKITLINDQPISRHEALDLLFKAFRLNGIGVVETEREIIIDLLSEIPKIQDPGVVLGPDDDVMGLTEDGVIVSKVFRVKIAKADAVAEQIQDFMPDYATLKVDLNANQIILQGNIGLAKRVQMLIDALDKPAYVNVETRTFRLAYADATVISGVVLDLFEASRSAGARAGQQPGVPGRPQPQQRGARPGGAAAAGGSESVGTSEQIRVTVVPQINAVTVTAEPEILEQIADLINNYWDIPLSETEGDLFRVYTLRYADPIVVRDVLSAMLDGSGGGTRTGGRGGPGGAAARPGGGGGGGGGESGADAAVANIFRIDAIPDNRQLMVISRTPENFKWLTQVIEEIDKPTQAGLPILVQLKHANAVEVSEQLNALLSEAGSGATIRDVQTGLTRGDLSTGSIIEGTGGTTGGGTAGGGDRAGGAGGAAPGTISFPWQGGRAGGAESGRSPESAIVGKVRIVPIARQNALSILATPEMQDAVVDIISQMDKPGRQVLVSAIIAAVDLKNEFAYGLRVSKDGIVTPLSDNSLGGNFNSTNEEQNFLSFFDSSILNVNVSANVVLQALDQRTNVKILQQPKLFVSDNTEGVVFIGQEIPFITDSFLTDVGGQSQSFDYKPVGVLLNVRPRITQQRDVSLEVNLTLSNVVPGQTLFGGAILDRRSTETQVTIRNGQTVVISGIRVESQSDVKRKVPLLGDIPGLGDLLFASTDKSDNIQELIAFITPIVVDNPEENDLNFNEDARRRLEDLEMPLRDLIERGRDSEPFDPVRRPGHIPPVPDDTAPEGPRVIDPSAPPEETERTPSGGSAAPTSEPAAPPAAPPAAAPPPARPARDPGERGGMGR